MLIPTHGRYRRSERGQTLILALAFLAFFGVVSVAILRFADLTAVQHVHTEMTASSDSSANGGAAFGSADASRSDLPGGWKCSDTGTLTMTNGAKVGYTVNSCNPGETAALAAGATCLLCVLNETPAPGHALSPKTVVLTLGSDLTTYGGNDDVNGSISSGTSLTALSCSKYPAPPCTGQASGEIRLLSGATYPAKTSDPGANHLHQRHLRSSECTCGADWGWRAHWLRKLEQHQRMLDVPFETGELHSLTGRLEFDNRHRPG